MYIYIYIYRTALLYIYIYMFMYVQLLSYMDYICYISMLFWLVVSINPSETY